MSANTPAASSTRRLTPPHTRVRCGCCWGCAIGIGCCCAAQGCLSATGAQLGTPGDELGPRPNDAAWRAYGPRRLNPRQAGTPRCPAPAGRERCSAAVARFPTRCWRSRAPWLCGAWRYGRSRCCLQESGAAMNTHRNFAARIGSRHASRNVKCFACTVLPRLARTAHPIEKTA